MAPSIEFLPVNQITHYYRGGDAIKALRGGPGGPSRPEEWIASTTARFNSGDEGLSRLSSGSYLRDEIIADPVGWLGPAHVDKYGNGDTCILVKLLDVGQRSPVHFHPTRSFANRYLGMHHGKAEAWIVLEAAYDAVVGLGFRHQYSPNEVSDLVANGDSASLLGALNSFTVQPGDTIMVPSGCPHYISKGLLILEIEEPTDLSVLLEWEDLPIDGYEVGHLGLGFDIALTDLDFKIWTSADLERVIRRIPTTGDAGLVPLLASEAMPYFRADRIGISGVDATVSAGYAVTLVLEGNGTIRTANAGSVDISRGDAVLIPWAVGDWTWSGSANGIVCRPPAPDAPPATL